MSLKAIECPIGCGNQHLGRCACATALAGTMKVGLPSFSASTPMVPKAGNPVQVGLGTAHLKAVLTPFFRL